MMLLLCRCAGRIGGALLALAAAVALGGCLWAPPPEVVIVTHEPPPPVYPAECVSDDTDRKWIDPPDDDLRRNAGSRLIRKNKDRHNALLLERGVCRAVLLEMQSSPASAGRAE